MLGLLESASSVLGGAGGLFGGGGGGGPDVSSAQTTQTTGTMTSGISISTEKLIVIGVIAVAIALAGRSK